MRGLGVGLAALFVLGSCAPAPTTEPSGPARGGTVVIAWQEPQTLNPLYSTGAQTDALVYEVAVEGLLRPGPDAAYLPALAAEVPTLRNGGVTVAADGSAMTVRYKLRDGVRWSDGAPFTSADVRFTWSVIMRDPKVASREGYDQIEDVATPDQRTVVVRYRGVYPAYLGRFDAVLPEHVLGAAADISRTDYGRLPLGTGPFRITEFVSGDHITAERNANYRVAGRPLLDRLVFRITPSVEAAKAQLVAGEVRAAPSLGEADVPELRRAGMNLDVARSPSVEALMFNLARPGNPADPAVPHPILGDRAMRRALLLATPKQLLVDRLLFGQAMVGRSEVPIGWAAPSDLTQESYDPDAARRVLDQAGWQRGADGVRVRAGVRASLAVTGTTGNKLREQVEQVLVEEWKAIGVELRLRNVPPSTLVGSWSAGGVRKRGDFDVVLAQLGLGGAGGSDPHAYLSQRHRCDAIPRAENGGAGANYERFCDPRVDTLLAAAGRTIDPEQRRSAYAEVLRLVNDNVLAIWLYDRSRINVYRPELAGYRANVWDQATWNVEEWYVVTSGRG